MRGMTVIELAFTISIVGLMMFFALKGKDVIEGMRSVAVMYEMEQYQRLIVGYQDTYDELPGDDPRSPNRWNRPSALTVVTETVTASLAGNSKLDGKLYEVGNPGGEQFAAWRDLRFSGALEGDPKFEGTSALPENPFGGFYGLDEGNLGQKEGSLCATRIPGRAAQRIDAKMDDGRINSGKVVATSKFSIEDRHHFPAPDTEPYNIEKEYIICIPMMP
ncbi:MAG: hypothetical protein JNK21_01055 [Rhodospirillaceae bacterium]|nr:hypothetical protein [Rhodospirillaceae bacterium]